MALTQALRRASYVGLSLLAAASLSAAAGRNLSPDAITRATTWNEHQGEIAWLADGLVPPDGAAQAFAWHTKGTLAFEWEGARHLERLRIRVGSVANDYQVRTFLGGHLQDEGATRDPEGEQTARVEDLSRLKDSWLEVELPAGTLADNLELRALGPAHFYEVEILTADGGSTVVEARTWARVKDRAP